MSGWGDKDKLDAARALHDGFQGLSLGSRGHGVKAGGNGTGRSRGRGHGSASPSPVRGLDNFGSSSSSNNNIISSAGRGRGGPPARASGGPIGFGSNNIARGGGSGGYKRPAVPLATSDEFFAQCNKENKATGSTRGPNADSSTRGTSAGAAQKAVAVHANNSGGPMERDKPTQSSNTTTNPSNPGHSLMTSRWGNNSVVATPTQGNAAMSASNTDKPMDRYSSKNVQSNVTLVEPEGPKYVLMSSQWGTLSTDNFGVHKKTGKRTEDPKGAQSTTATKPGLSASRWAESPPPPSPIPSELPPIYRSNDWIKDLHQDNRAEAMRRGHPFQAVPAGQAKGGPRVPSTKPAMLYPVAQIRADNPPAQGTATPATAFIEAPKQANIAAQPAAHPAPALNVPIQGQAYTQRPNAPYLGTQLTGQQSTRPDTKPLQHVGFGGKASSAEFCAGHVVQPAQSIGGESRQKPPQTARPIVGNAGQQSAQCAQRSQDPFDDPVFKSFWENVYMRNDSQS